MTNLEKQLNGKLAGLDSDLRVWHEGEELVIGDRWDYLTIYDPAITQVLALEKAESDDDIWEIVDAGIRAAIAS